jgi:hypothetical protein
MQRILVAIIPALVMYLSISTAAVAVEAGEADSIALTIYNDDLALIRETRLLALAAGTQDVILTDVSGALRPNTVHLNIPGLSGYSLLEQNYDYDLVSREKLMERFIGKRITLVDDELGSKISGTLLSVSGGIILDNGGEILLNPPGRVVLPPGAADELLLRPTLSWLLYSPEKTNAEAEITYLSRGLSWEADYVLQLNKNDTAAGIEGWVTLSNYSGTTYNNAQLKLVAGDVNQVSQPDMRMAKAEMLADGMGAGAGGFVEEEFFEYHLYQLGRATTIRNNQQKQIGLLSAQEVPMEKIFLFNAEYGGDVRVMVEFTNEEEAGMGMPLPEGVVRVFKADSGGDVQFVGEDRIDHTPRDEDVRLEIGNAFDIVGETRKMDYRDIGDGFEADYVVNLRNHKEKDDVVVTVEMNGLWGDWEVISSNFDFIREDVSTLQFDIPVPADGEAELKFSYRVEWK